MTEKFGEDYFYGKNNSNYSNYDNLDSSKHFKSVISFIKSQKLKRRFLDIGCAFGFLLKEVSLFFPEIYGCDVSQFAIKKAKQKVPKANLKLIDLDSVDSLSYPNEFFDCITACDVLEHTKNFEDNFKKIVAKLKSGGSLIISVPIESWPRKFFGFLDKDKTHISILKEDKIMKIADKNELTLFSKKYFCRVPIFYRIPHIRAEIELVFIK